MNRPRGMKFLIQRQDIRASAAWILSAARRGGAVEIDKSVRHGTTRFICMARSFRSSNASGTGVERR